MPQFKSREEYERWKAERMGGHGANSQKQIQQENPKRPETLEKLPTPPTRSPEERPPSNNPPYGQGLRSFGELFRDTWDLFKARFLTLICLYLLSGVSMVAVAGVFAGTGFLLVSMVPISKNVLMAGLIVTGIVTSSIVMSWGFAAFTFAAVDETLGIRDALGRGWGKVWSFIWVSSLFAFIVGGGFLLFLIPGVIFLIWFLFSQFVVVAENERGMGALLKSKEYVRSNWFGVFLRAFVIWLIAIGLGFIPMVGSILSILFAPFMILFIKLIYDDLRNLKGKVALHAYSVGAGFKWIGAGAMGYVVFPLLLFAMMGPSLIVPLFMLKGRLSNSESQFKSANKKIPVPIRIESGAQHQAETEGQQSQVQSGVSPFSEAKKQEATGEALIVRDGRRETFILKTGFFSETRMANPRRASIQFQIPAEKHSNARRIEMVLDASKVGEHSIDGNFVRDTFMGRSSEPSEQEYKPKFQYIADGGQVFFPQDSCTIVVTSPYTGTPDSIFAGQVKDCLVTSAGINHTLSAEFKMVGASSR